MAHSKHDAILAINPAATFTTTTESGEDVITWTDGFSPISDSDITAKQTELDNLFTANKYQRDRRPKYAEIEEQLDQLYHDMTAGKLDATGEWHKAIKAVKDAHPK